MKKIEMLPKLFTMLAFASLSFRKRSRMSQIKN